MSGPFLPGLADLFATPPAILKWATPGDLAQTLDHRNVQTPALDLIDRALVEAYNTPDSRLIISMPPQEGKLVADDTPVPTPTGWVRHGDLRAGDYVMHPSGRPVRVLEVHAPSVATMRVDTSDHGSVYVHPRHEWTVHDHCSGITRTVETAAMARVRLDTGKPGRGHRYRFQLPTHEAFDLPTTDLPLDPYTLGVWLGDGTTVKPAVTHHPSDTYVLPYEISSIQIHPTTGIITDYYVGLWADLKAAGVAGNKHIPAAYLRASEAQRRALLAGLIDTDGHVSQSGQVSFDNANERMVRDVAELLRTLGYRAHVHQPTEPKLSSSGIQGVQVMWRVTFTPHDQGPARLQRKAPSHLSRIRRRVSIIGVTEVPARPGRCITVDSADGLYLIGETMLPTHNSTRVGVMFPLWVLAQDKSKAVVLTSYSDRLVRKNSKNVRNFITTDGDKMGLSLARDSRSATQWKLAKERGGMYAVSIGGSLTGEPADLIIIDDPHKGAKEAESENQREDVWEWWLSTASARLGPGASVVMILTRWHEDDLAGRFMSAEDGGVWKYINIPAQADHNPDKGESDILGRRPGEFMASARKRSREQWQATKTRQTARNWNALYQGRPSSAAGTVFRRDQWQWYTQPLWTTDDNGACVVTGDGDRLIQSWDMTFKATSSSDFVVGQVWLKRGPNAYLLDQVRRRMTFTETVKAVEAMTAKWPQAETKLIEDKANGTAVLDVLRARMPGLIAIVPKESKEARASAVTWAIEAHNVHLPAPELAAWSDGLVEEAASFPTGAHDDQVDALTQALNRLMVNAGQGNAWLEYGRTKTETTTTDEGGGPVNGITSRIGTNNRPVRSERPVPTARLWGQ